MEAARTLRLQPDRVEVEDGRVVIDALTLDDRTVVELVASRAEQGIAGEDTVRDAVEIGARVLDREATQAEVDFVRREFERTSGEVERAFAERAEKVAGALEEQLEQFLGADGGAMPKALEAHAGELAELIASNFGGDRATAVQHQLRELVQRQLQESRQELLRQFSAEDGHNPLTDFKGAVVRELKTSAEVNRGLAEKLGKLEGEIARLRDADAAQTELHAERERSAVKGHDFEQRTFELLERIADGRGDVAQHVGNERSEAGGKRGDFVVELDAASSEPKGRIVLDTKDERLSRNEAWKVLNESLVERDAGFAILVVASDEKLPARVEPLREYEGNKMIVTLDKESFDERALELAYRYARCRCLMAREQGLEVDAAAVRAAAEEALSTLKEAQKVRLALTNITNSASGARETFDAMVARVQASLERVEALIAAG
ncbi:MAG TPA: hypothetical protein VGR10_08015 [Thermoleophilaceae bacterium]|nr:hypothetical protein [Thermoleophilaceae bacterium]